jgi:cardiolipin synthase
MWIAAIAGALAAVLITIVVLNVTTGEKRIEHKLEHRHGVGDAQFRRELSTLLGPPIAGGNRVAHLENGAQIFPAMLESIRAARRTICFETFIYWSGQVGREFVEALGERARAGVRVHVLIDWVGSQRMERSLIEELKAAGAEVEYFHPLKWYHLARINNRTHRKLLVVDGTVGFTGGVGIADNWAGNADSPDHWRDSHYRVEGPVVAQMQAAFLDNWIKTTGTVLQGEDYFPPLGDAGEVDAQVFTASPSGGGDSMLLMYLMAITSARESIDLSAAYFVPDTLALAALKDALRRGVRVRVVVPGRRIDRTVVRKASRAAWGELLRAGAEIHEFKPTMFHCKTLVVDRLLVSVGSTNFDNRSFRLNEEANLNVYDREFAERTTAVLEHDLTRSRRIEYDAWRRRPWHEKIVEKASALLSPQL